MSFFLIMLVCYLIWSSTNLKPKGDEHDHDY